MGEVKNPKFSPAHEHREDFLDAMRSLAAGVHIVTTHHDKRDYGLTMTAVCSLSDAPPSLLLSIARSSTCLDAILASRRLCVNFLDQTHTDLADRFAGGHGVMGPEKFEQGDWGRHPPCPPVLQNAPVALQCKVTSAHEIATHNILACEVIGTHMGDATAESMLLYGDRNFGMFARSNAA